MENRIEIKFLAWTPLINVVLLGAMGITCFTVAYFRGDVSSYIPLISETANFGPSLHIFMIGSMFSSVLVSIIVLHKYLLLRYHIGSGNRNLHVYNGWACIIGLIGSCLLFFVTVFPLSANTSLHGLFAMSYFAFILVYTCLDSYLNRKILRNKRHTLRLYLLAMQVTFGVLFIVTYPTAKHFWKVSNPKGRGALKDPSQSMFGFLFVACMFEWLMYVSYVFYLATFTVEFRHFHLVMGAVPSISVTSTDAETNDKSTSLDQLRDNVHIQTVSSPYEKEGIGSRSASSSEAEII